MSDIQIFNPRNHVKPVRIIVFHSLFFVPFIMLSLAPTNTAVHYLFVLSFILVAYMAITKMDIPMLERRIRRFLVGNKRETRPPGRQLM